MTPEAKKRMEHLSHDISDAAEALGFESGYKAGYNDPDRQGILEECEKAFIEIEAMPSVVPKVELNRAINLANAMIQKLKAARVK